MKTTERYSIILLVFGLLLMMFSVASAQESTGVPAKRSGIKFVKPEVAPNAVLGAGIGSQTGISLLGGLYFDPYAIRVSGGFFPSGWQGAQVDLSYLVSHALGMRHDVSLIGGIFRYEDTNDSLISQQKRAEYFGAAYSVFIQGLHFQIGIAYGDKEYHQFVPLFQAGYVFKLW